MDVMIMIENGICGVWDTSLDLGHNGIVHEGLRDVYSIWRGVDRVWRPGSSLSCIVSGRNETLGAATSVGLSNVLRFYEFKYRDSQAGSYYRLPSSLLGLSNTIS